jgi:preprotein translocase subunit SecE
MYERAMVFLQEVRSELLRVNWPTKDELVGSTSVVIVITIILAIFVGLVDLILSSGVSLLLRN